MPSRAKDNTQHVHSLSLSLRATANPKSSLSDVINGGLRGGVLPRTYSNANLNDVVRSDDDDDVSADPFRISLSQDTVSQFSFNFSSSSQDSPSQFDSLKRPNVLRRAAKKSAATATATLMEAHEFGEMMEHVDEVNFALDGLRRGQAVRIRRASLLSLLGICATSQKRRLLRTQGLNIWVLIGFEKWFLIVWSALFIGLNTDHNVLGVLGFDPISLIDWYRDVVWGF